MLFNRITEKILNIVTRADKSVGNTANLQGGAGPSNIANGSTNISTTLGTNFGNTPGTRTYIIQGYSQNA